MTYNDLFRTGVPAITRLLLPIYVRFVQSTLGGFIPFFSAIFYKAR